MAILQLNPHTTASLPFSSSHKSKYTFQSPNHLKFSTLKRIRAVDNASETQQDNAVSEDEPPAVNFAFVSAVLLPDGTPDVHYRSACGGQKLRDIMLDCNIDLYGPYARPLLNCGGGGTCGTCIVEVVEGRDLLTFRTDKEKEKLKRNPKNWRLACQATVGTTDSRGMMVVQQLPEWKGHQWTYGTDLPEDEITDI